MNEHISREDIFNILRTLATNNNPTQRELSTHLGFSLGKTNYLIKELAKKGLVKTKAFSHKDNKLKRISYVLTPRGFKEKAGLTLHFLEKKELEYNELRNEWEHLRSLQSKVDSNKKNHTDINFGNFSEIIEFNARKYPQKLFCVDHSTDRSITYAEFNSYVNRCCNFLKDMSVGEGDIVSVCIKNGIAFMIIYFASMRLGASVNPLPASLSYQEIKKNMEFLPVKLLFAEDRFKGNDFTGKGSVFFMDYKHDCFFDAISKYPPSYKSIINEDSIACYYYTSGTTNNPKCIMYTHKNMVSLVRSMTKSFHFAFSDIHLGFLPLGHTAITNYQLLPAVYNASTLLLYENFMKLRADFWKIIRDNSVTYVEVVPSVLFMMLNTPYQDADIAGNTTLKYIGCGSAPLAVDIQKQAREKFGIPVANLYGLSETGPTHFDDPFRDGWRPGSVGKPIDACECRIFREDKTDADIGEVGEIAVKGDNVFRGYYKNDAAYQQVMHNGYFLTGDLGYKDKDGYFYFADRKKDLIIKGGVNIVPAEVEEVLYQLQEVQIAAVIGIEDVIYGEDVVAFVKLKDGFIIGEDKIKVFCAENLQGIKCPKEIYIIDDMPLGPSGKILKKELKKRYAENYYGRKQAGQLP
ncbi:MAG: MarR family EPS-associated transcriptional regulator [Candidatus Omnitrophica bacterium]|nr:MarR family EPS-associated transcriptional regulator [Candidatus Omnitrophota bacterium]